MVFDYLDGSNVLDIGHFIAKYQASTSKFEIHLPRKNSPHKNVVKNTTLIKRNKNEVVMVHL